MFLERDEKRTPIEKILKKYFPEMDRPGMFTLILELDKVSEKREQAAVKAFANGLRLEVTAQPCKVDCTPVEHAYHQGQWDLEQKLQEVLDELQR